MRTESAHYMHNQQAVWIGVGVGLWAYISHLRNVDINEDITLDIRVSGRPSDKTLLCFNTKQNHGQAGFVLVTSKDTASFSFQAANASRYATQSACHVAFTSLGRPGVHLAVAAIDASSTSKDARCACAICCTRVSSVPAGSVNTTLGCACTQAGYSRA